MSIPRRLAGVIAAAAILLAAWPAPYGSGDPAVVLPTGAIGVPTTGATPAPSARQSPAPPEPAFAEECTGALRPEWSTLHAGNDAGFGLDSDFLGDLRQVSVADGMCTITAARVETPSGRPFASAAISTKGAFAQLYGTFEARVRYPAGQGLWPAFWLLRDQPAIGGPPEIDIFEAYPGRGGLGGGSGPSVVVSSLHYAGGTHHFSHHHGSDMTADFHTHRLVWSPGLLVFSIDGVETGRITRDVPDVAMYPILNLAVGARGFRADETTPQVATMDIDYVRIWPMSSGPTAGLTDIVAPTPTALEPTPAPTQRRTDASTPRPADPRDQPRVDPTEKPGKTLTFAEECSNKLRPEWHALYGPGDSGYAEDTDFMGDLRQVSVADGRCRITATRTDTPSGEPYASGAMTTKGNFAQRYGTFEVRVRYPAGQGIWPAFLMLKQQAVVTTPPEIDVFEAYPAPPGAGGGSGTSVAVSTLHSGGGIHYFVYDHGSDMTTHFHTHRVRWSPGQLVFWIDGVETGRITQDVPDVAMFPVLSLAVGAPGYLADASTPDTAVMEIDYLRVWAP